MSAKPLLLLGNEAITRGAIEAGAKFVACYPGTPSSEVVESLLAMGSPGMRIEYSVNEKVAFEAACGAAIAGAPSLVTMKHVGLNVAADPLFTSAYIGTPGGLVVLTADDPGCHSSQNEQDNRGYARMAKLCCLEPASAGEAKAMTAEAFRLSAELQEPVLLRTTTRTSHMRGPVIENEPACGKHPEFELTAGRFVPVPVVARKRHRVLAEQLAKAARISENSPFNKTRLAKSDYGIIASGIARAYLADALNSAGWQNDVSVLELGMSWPLPEKRIRGFLAAHKNILVLEEGDPLLEKDIRAIAQDLPVSISGKNADLTEFGEYSTSLVQKRIADWLGRKPKQEAARASKLKLPQRPPNLCPGCSHRSVYYAVRKVFGDDAVYSSDIGCYTLGLLPPLKAADFLVCMGSSVSAGSGYSRASGKQVVAFIGDSTFFHSGLTGVANAVFNRHDLLLVILDNGTTAMTGHQPNPGMEQDCLGENACQLEIGKALAGLGVTQMRQVASHNLAQVTAALNELKDLSGVRVLHCKEPCLIHAGHNLKRRREAVAYVKQQGEEAEKCLAELACPAFTRKGADLAVDESLCAGCLLCLQIAPKAFGSRKPA